MENKIFWVGLLVIILVFGMAIVGCDDGSTDDDYKYDDRPYIPGAAVLDNYYPVVGETITASLEQNSWHSAPIGTASWKWYKTQEDSSFLSSITNKTTIGYSNTYTVRQNDVGFWIWVELSYSGHRGTSDRSTYSTVIGIPATATVSVSMSAVYAASSSYRNHRVTVTLTLSDGRWNDITGRWTEDYTYISPYDIASKWISISGTPSLSSWYTGSQTPFVSSNGRNLVFSYTTQSATILSIGLTTTLNTDQLNAMRSNTNVYNSLTVGTPSTVSVSQWTLSDY